MNKPTIATTVIGFDYGRKNIGVAVGQTLTRSANALTVLRYSETKQSKAVVFKQIKQLINEWKPSKLIIGWPLNMDDTESELCAEVRKFADRLKAENNLPIEFVDERLTSREAKSVREKSESNYRKNPVDSEAARILLESWLREQA